jgi:hypothetical protein
MLKTYQKRITFAGSKLIVGLTKKAFKYACKNQT